jgi:O-antigen/teichoic acid export membrane protein
LKSSASHHTPTVGSNQDVLLWTWALRMLLATAFTALLARRLGVEDFGFVTLMGTYLLGLHVLMDLGTGVVALREIVARPNEERTILGELTALRLSLALAVAVLFAVLGLCEPSVARRGVLLSMAAFSPLLSLATGQIALQKRLRPHLPAWVGVLTQASALLLLWWLPFDGVALSGSLVALLVFGRDLANGLVAWVAGQRQVGAWILPRFRGGTFAWLRLAWPQGRFVLLQLVWFHVDMPLMRWLCTEEELGRYAAATRPVLPLLLIPSMLMLPLLVRLTQATVDGAREVVAQASALLTGLGAMGFVAALFGAGELLELIYPASRAQDPHTIQAVRWLGLAFLAVFAAAAPLTALTARKRERMLLWTGVVAVLLNVSANLIWTAAVGAEAAAAITACTELVVAIGACWCWQRAGAPVLNLKLLGWALLPASCLGLLLSVLTPSPWSVVFSIAMAVVLFGMLPPLAKARRALRQVDALRDISGDGLT